MADQGEHPGPGRSTSESALNAIKKQVAERNAQAHREDKKRRAPYERERAEKGRRNAD